MSEMTIAIPGSFRDYVEAAIVRASYLFPEMIICTAEDSLSVDISGLDESMDFEQIKKEFLNVLYRERIYSETLPIRRTIYGAKDE